MGTTAGSTRASSAPSTHARPRGLRSYTVPNYTEAITDTPHGITAGRPALVNAVRNWAPSPSWSERQIDGKSAVIVTTASETPTIPFELIRSTSGDTFSSVLLGRVMVGWTLQRATADAMRVVSELIARNASQQDKSAGLPIEACLDVIDGE